MLFKIALGMGLDMFFRLKRRLAVERKEKVG
jgi:hypothetical protein